VVSEMKKNKKWGGGGKRAPTRVKSKQKEGTVGQFLTKKEKKSSNGKDRPADIEWRQRWGERKATVNCLARKRRYSTAVIAKADAQEAAVGS